MRLKDKVALITGSSRGIGAATAKLFAKNGAKVTVHYHSKKEKAQKVQEIIGKDNSLLIKADVTKENEIKNLVEKTVNKFGKIDILINNAGAIIRPGDWQSDIETWQKTIDTNLTSAWLTIRESADHIKKQKGAIINVSSVFGFTGAAAVLAYTSAKGGLNTLTKSFAKELAPEIRVNSIAPSTVMTDMTKGAGEELIEFFKKETPLSRIADPMEIAKPILFLASSDASYITGEMLVVDGGYSLR